MEKPSFREAVKFWSKLGWISFGGTAGHIAIMHDFLVDKKRWISNSKFLHALSHCMLLPGPEAQQLAIYIGWQLHGKKGGLAAGILFVLPSMFILLGLSLIYVLFGGLPWMAAVFSGLKPAVIALIIIALFKVGQKALKGSLHFIAAAVAFVALYWFSVSLITLISGAILLAILIGYIRPGLFHHKEQAQAILDEEGYYLNKYSRSPDSAFRLSSILKLLAAALLCWLLPMVLFYFLSGDFAFWSQLILFFTKTAFVTIGGSYTVIPYVAQYSVSQLHWLSNPQMMDGFALAETTPGPLIIVLAYVGFMSGYNHFHGSLWLGAAGLLATTFYTFLPCFLFVFAGASLVERSQGNPIVEGILGLVTSVVVGAILNLTLFLGKGVLFPAGQLGLGHLDWIALLWVGISMLLVKKVKMNVVYVILLSIFFGLGRWLLQK